MKISNIESNIHLRNVYLLFWIVSIGIASLMTQVSSMNLSSVSCLPLFLTIQNIARPAFVIKFTTEVVSHIGTSIIYTNLILHVKATRMEIQTHLSDINQHKHSKLIIKVIISFMSNTCLIIIDILMTIIESVDSNVKLFNYLPFFVATFVLPVHSIVNPILHTIYTEQFIKSFIQLFAHGKI